ncbi:MAG: hypothetical protein WKF35_04800 [Ferruginibacter sp.]
MQDLKNSLLQEYNERLNTNFNIIANLIITPYNWPLLDAIRIEICDCILVGASQAAVTLTNHLLEKSLKALLMHNEPTNQNYTDAAEIEAHFENLNNQYGGMILQNTIDACVGNGLITDEQGANLHEFRKKFRNAFGHADPKKTFGETKKRIGIFNPFVHEEFQFSEVKVANFPFLQDKTQKEIANNECVNYFRYVDSVIKEVMPKLFKQ